MKKHNGCLRKILHSAVFFMLIFILLTPSGEADAASKKKSYQSLIKKISKMVRANPPQKVNGLQSTNAYATKRLIVKTKNDKVNLKKYGAKQILKGSGHLYFLQFRTMNAAKSAAKKLKKLKNVVYVEPDRVVGVTGTAGAGEYTPLSWGPYQADLVDFSKYVAARTSKSIKVAVIDTGVYSHRFLKARLVKGADPYENSSKTTDKNGHGTHVAGIIVDSTPGLNVQIVPIRVGEDEEPLESEIAFGIWYATEQLGAKVINLSLGQTGRMRLVEDFINEALKKDCVVVVSSGNNNQDINKVKFCPAYMNNVITVGATDGSNQRASFSNYGKSLDVVAPGVDIYSTWKKGKYRVESGTSMAAPYVTALAAVLRLLYPGKKAGEIKTLIREYALDLGTKGWDKYYGYGLIQAPTAYTSLKLKDETVSLAAGSQRTLQYTLSNKFLNDRNVKWTSSDTGIVSVNDKGVITGKKAGSAVVTVSGLGKTASCTVNVSGYSERQAALNLYDETLKNGINPYGDSSFAAYFCVIDLDDNNIPELVVSDSAQNHDSFTLYGVNGKILDVYDLFDVSTDNHSIRSWYYPRKGVLFSTIRNNAVSSADGVSYITDYQYALLSRNGAKTVQLPLLKSEWHYKSGKVSENYVKIGSTNEKIEKTVFEKQLKQYVGDTQPVAIKMYQNTQENRKRWF